MSFLHSLLGPTPNDPRKEVDESVETLERFARELMGTFESELFENESPASEVLRAFTFGALTALGTKRHLRPDMAMDIWVELNSRLFGSSQDEAHVLAKNFLDAWTDHPDHHTPTLNQGLTGFKLWQQHGIEAALSIFEPLVLHVLLLSLCSGGNGDSPANAVCIEADNHMIGVQAEYAYIARACGLRGADWHFKEQRMHQQDGRLFDVLTIVLGSGQERSFYFDITSFFSKRPAG